MAIIITIYQGTLGVIDEPYLKKQFAYANMKIEIREIKFMKIYESSENYLETILILQDRIGEVRSIDIANEMGFTKPSISRAMSRFKESGYITMDNKGRITLTDAGKTIATQMYERHCLLTNYLIAIGVNRDVAVSDACRIEHVISQESFERIKDHATKTL